MFTLFKNFVIINYKIKNKKGEFIKTYFYNLELTSSKTFKEIDALIAQLNNTIGGNTEMESDAYSDSHLDLLKNSGRNLKTYYFHASSEKSPDDFKKTIALIYKKYGVNFSLNSNFDYNDSSDQSIDDWHDEVWQDHLEEIKLKY